MDVDIPSTTVRGVLEPYVEDVDDTRSSKQKVMEMLDSLEYHVEKLRKDAAKLEEDKDKVLASLDTLRMLPIFNDLADLDKDEAFTYLEHIMERCQTVEVNINTQRDAAQEEALHQVNHLIDSLVVMLKTDNDAARVRCLTYMNSCSSLGSGPTDKHFESALLGCTIDDQKRVKKRLQGLLKYFNKMGIVTEV